MKRKNPYILVSIIWLLLTAIFATASVVLFVDGRVGLGALLVCVACGFGIVTGALVEKSIEIAQFNAQIRFLEQAHEALAVFVEEMEENEKNRPFKEFDKPKEVPFEEVRNKEKLQ